MLSIHLTPAIIMVVFWHIAMTSLSGVMYSNDSGHHRIKFVVFSDVLNRLSVQTINWFMESHKLKFIINLFQLEQLSILNSN